MTHHLHSCTSKDAVQDSRLTDDTGPKLEPSATALDQLIDTLLRSQARCLAASLLAQPIDEE